MKITPTRIVQIGFFLICSLGSPLYAIDCTPIAPAQPTLRQSGLTEGIGDIILTCTNPPTSTTAVDISVYLQSAVTSRGFSGTTPPSSEALLLINEPGSGLPGAPVAQVVCSAQDILAHTCSADANVFPGFLRNNVVTFFNVPIPTSGLSFGPPGGIISLRITNIREDLSALPVLGGQPGTLTAAVVISGGAVNLENPTSTVAFYGPGLAPPQVLLPDASGLVPSGGLALSQCVPVNRTLALDPASPSAPDGVSFVLRIPEAFTTAFKSLSLVRSAPADVNTRPVAEAQDIPGAIYNSETMFFNPVFPGDLAIAGLATQGTRIQIRFNGPPFGVQVHAPVYERGKGPLDSRVRLVAGTTDGSWPTYAPLGPLSALNTFYSGSQMYVYEVTAKAPPSLAAIDTIDLPFYLAHTGMPYVTPGATSVNVSLAPTSTDVTPFGTYIPRFADISSPLPVANLTACAGSPALKALISGKSGPVGARMWQIGINNYGTAAATSAKITNVGITQTFGPACTPVIGTAFPVTVGTVAASSTVNGSVTLNFAGCTAASRFKVDIRFAADGGIAGTSTYFNQFQ